MPDPKLVAVMEEIKQVLAKHDLAGLVMISSPSSIEYLHHFPSWVCITINDEGFVRFKSKAVDYPDEATQKKVLQDSVGTIAGFMDTARVQADMLEKLLQQVGKSIKFDHITRRDTPG